MKKWSSYFGSIKFGVIDKQECSVDFEPKIMLKVKGQSYSCLKGIHKIIVPYCTF
jgi:hypothetical protein